MIPDILKYIKQMVPLGLVALAVFLLLRPIRKKRLKEQRITSSFQREIVLVLFVMFCAGLAALTLFPANLWAYVYDFFFCHQRWELVWGGCTMKSFYPTWEETASNFAYLPQVLTPFEEIFRALNRRSYWLLFMLMGNIVMFIPIGFFPALLWRGWRWWKSLLAGLCTSVTIEFVQFFIGRSTDIDDVILNTIGALLGFWIFCLLRAIFPSLAEKLQCRSRGGYYYG